MWTDEWVGLPYLKLGRSREGVDCLGLFAMLQKTRFDRAIRDPHCTMGEAARRKIAQQHKLSWETVSTGQEGDALLFTVKGLELHVGFCLPNNKMLHIESDTGSLIEDWGVSKWGQRLEGIYRFVE